MKNSIKKLSGKGLAAAVCACIALIGGAGIYSYTKLTNKLNTELISMNNTKTSSETTAQTKAPDEKAVGAEVTGVVKTETSPTQTTLPENPSQEVDVTAANINENSVNAAAKPAETTANQVMVKPVNGDVINAFSDGDLVKSNTLNVWKTHDGVDISGAVAEKVKSMTTGTVTKIYEDSMLGMTIIIDHNNGLEGYYSNLSADMSIAEGDKVSAGTVIGSIGTTATSEIKDAPHLHFAMKKNGVWIDPISMISSQGS